MSIIVKQATIEHLEKLHQIERECFTVESFSKQHIAHLLGDPNSVSLIAQVNSEIAGFIIGSTRRNGKRTAGQVYTIDVAIKYRRMGVGLRLLEELERIFVQRRVEVCYLEARVDNVAARKLYRRLGYMEMEKLEHYYRGAHGVRLKKILGT